MGDESSGQSPLTDPFWLGDWRVEASANRLSNRHRSVTLEPRTMKVLLCLAQRAGQVVSRETLENEVWPRVVVGYDSLNNAISKLRKAFGDDSHHPQIIETIPKVGYRLVASVQETPSGPGARTGPSIESPPDTRAPALDDAHSRRRLAIAIVSLLVIAVGVILYYSLDTDREPSKPDDAAVALQEKPSIAVLPFKNLSGDPEQEYFCDGMTDDLITDLSKVAGLFVIARNSSFAYKGKSMDVREVARALGVRYVLEGSVRRSSSEVRVNAQLVDGETGRQLWAERYDGQLTDVFALQDRVTSRIASALAVTLTEKEIAWHDESRPTSVEAYDAFLKGQARLRRQTPEDAYQAVELFEQAIEHDPEFARAHAALAQTYWNYSDESRFTRYIGFYTGQDQSPDAARDIAWEHLQRARSRPSPEGHVLTARMLQRQRRFEEAMRQARKAVELSPNDAVAYDVLIENLIYAGEFTEASTLARESMALDPILPGEKLFLLGLAAYADGRLGEAVDLIERARTHNPDQPRYRVIEAAALSEVGRVDEANDAWRTYQNAINHYTTMNWLLVHWPFESPEIMQRLAESLLIAGLSKPLTSFPFIDSSDRLSGEEISELVSGRTMIGLDRGPGGVEAEFEVTRDRDAQIIRQGYLTYFKKGKTVIEDDLLCDPWWAHPNFCVAVFRNPQGDSASHSEYVFFTLSGFFTFSVFPEDG